MKDKVSIIVPVYNVSAYLDECVQSILSQTYTNLEVLLVDDGSTDGSAEICDKYAEADDRVKVIHQQNGGAGKAKNAALDVMTGDYVTFVDADDWLDGKFIETLFKALKEGSADIVQCDFEKVRKSASGKVAHGPYGDYTAQEFLERFLHDWTCCLLWNKLFRQETLVGLRFPEGRVIDDEFFTYRAVMAAKKVAVIPDSLYRYRQRKTGVTNQGRWRQRMLDRLAYYTERYDNISKAFPALKEAYLGWLADDLVRAKAETHEFPDLIKLANKCMRRYFWKVLFSKVSFKRKMGYVKVLLGKPKGKEKAKEDKNWEDFFD